MAVEVKHILNTLFKVDDDWRLQLFQAWPSIVGSLQTRIRLEKIQDDTVIIGVYESHWMQELYLLSRVLVSSINKHLKEPYIKNIRLKLIEDQKQKTAKKSFYKQKNCTRSLKLDSIETQALNTIADETLRSAMQEYYLRCLENNEHEDHA